MTGTIHLHAQVISRSDGRSATGAAAYRSCSRIEDERTGRIFDYRRKGGRIISEIALPDGCPAAFLDRAVLWNAVEAAEKSSNAQLARELEFSLPRQLTREQNIALAREYAEFFRAQGMCVDWSYHDPDFANNNPHIHMMLTLREVRADGTFAPKAHKEYLCRLSGEDRYMSAADFKAAKAEGWEKVYPYRNGSERRELTPSEAADWEGCRRASKDAIDRKVSTNDWNNPENVESWRALYAELQNKMLERAGHEERVDHRSFERRGVERVPQRHEGPAVTHMERKERQAAEEEGRAPTVVTDRRHENAVVAIINATVERIKEQVAKLRTLASRMRQPETDWDDLAAAQRRWRERVDAAFRRCCELAKPPSAAERRRAASIQAVQDAERLEACQAVMLDPSYRLLDSPIRRNAHRDLTAEEKSILYPDQLVAYETTRAAEKKREAEERKSRKKRVNQSTGPAQSRAASSQQQDRQRGRGR